MGKAAKPSAVTSSSSGGGGSSIPPGRRSVAAARFAAAERILKERCGVDLQQYVAEATLEKLLKGDHPPSRCGQQIRRQQQQQHEQEGEPFQTPGVADVLVGRGVPISKHPGNVLFRHLVAVNQPYFTKHLKTREERQHAIDVLVGHLEGTLGTRFLEEASSSSSSSHHGRGGGRRYRVIPYERVRDKFMTRFQETRAHRIFQPPSRVSDHPPPLTGDTTTTATAVAAITPDRPVSSRRVRSRITAVRDDESSSSSSSDTNDDDDDDDDDDEEVQPCPVVSSSSSSPSPSSIGRKDPRLEVSAAEESSDEEDLTTGKPRASRKRNAEAVTHSKIKTEHGDTGGKGCNDEGPDGTVGGELEEVKETLEKAGVPVETFLAECKIVPLTKGFVSKIDEREGEQLRVHNSYRPHDVVLGRGNQLMRHPGNVLFRHVMGGNGRLYKQLERPDKKIAAEALLSYFESRGIRFLDQVQRGSKYQTVPYVRVVDKFMTLLQKRTPKGVIQKAPRPSTTDVRPSETRSVPLPRRTVKKEPKEEEGRVMSESSSVEEESSDDESDSDDSDHEPLGDELKEVKQKLQKDGIFVESFLADGKIERLLRNYKPSNPNVRSKKGKPRVYRNYYSSDILFGRGPILMKHPGNVLFRHVIGRNANTYGELASPQKRTAVAALIGYFESKGIRFLESVSGGHQAVEYNRVLDKFVTLFKKDVPLGVKTVVGGDSDSEVEMVEIVRNQSQEDVSRTVDTLLKKRGTSLAAFLKKAVFKKDKNIDYKPSALGSRKSRGKKRAPTTRLQPLDVVFLRGGRYRMHPGNWLLRQVLLLNKDHYEKSQREEKKQVTDAILGMFESLNTRFLSVSEHLRYSALDYASSIGKIKQQLRNAPKSPPYIVPAKSKKRPAAQDGLKTRSLQKSRGVISAEKANTDAFGAGELMNRNKKQKVEPAEDSSVVSGDSGSEYKEFSTVGHFVARFEEESDVEEEEDVDEQLGPVLEEIRRALREKGNGAYSGDELVRDPSVGREVEKLARIYRHSPLRICKTRAQAPVPVFF